MTRSRPASCSRSASEKPETGTECDAATTSLIRAAAALLSAGTPAIRTSPAAGGTTTGAPGSAATSATRTNVVTAPCRLRRASSAIIPMVDDVVAGREGREIGLGDWHGTCL